MSQTILITGASTGFGRDTAETPNDATQPVQAGVIEAINMRLWRWLDFTL